MDLLIGMKHLVQNKDKNAMCMIECARAGR